MCFPTRPNPFYGAHWPQVLGRSDAHNVVRIQFARMAPGSRILMHQDMGGYAQLGHRIHMPVATHPNVTFDLCLSPDEEEEVNAAAGHGVLQSSAAGAADATTGAWRPLGGSVQPDGRGGGGMRGGPPRPGATAERAAQLDAEAECFTIDAPEGLVFELNNRAAHRVRNDSPVHRIHLVIDVAEDARSQATLLPGAVCEYDIRGFIQCPESAISGSGGLQFSE